MNACGPIAAAGCVEYGLEDVATMEFREDNEVRPIILKCLKCDDAWHQGE